MNIFAFTYIVFLMDVGSSQIVIKCIFVFSLGTIGIYWGGHLYRGKISNNKKLSGGFAA